MGWLRFNDGLPSMPSRGLGALDGQVKILSWDNQRLKPLVQIVEVPEGEQGTEATIAIMTDLAAKASTDPMFVLRAQEIVRAAHLAPKDFRGELETLFNYVVKNVRYTMDPRSLEWLQSPFYTLYVRGAGDCDDVSITLAALSGALGHGWGFRSYRADKARPTEFSHVVARLGYRSPAGPIWLTADATNLNDQRLGWDPGPDKYMSYRDWIIANP